MPGPGSELANDRAARRAVDEVYDQPGAGKGKLELTYLSFLTFYFASINLSILRDYHLFSMNYTHSLYSLLTNLAGRRLRLLRAYASEADFTKLRLYLILFQVKKSLKQ